MIFDFMNLALEEAYKGRGFTAPNPAVGAIVVKNNQIISKGYHKGAGLAHAEVEALLQAKAEANGADLYVTLEPCCHYGKTPPCTNAILESKIQRVFYGFQDPNPMVSGKGKEILDKAGIYCQKIDSKEVNDFYKSYDFWIKKRSPFVTAKLAISLDGKYALKGERLYLTSEKINQYTHRLRKNSDAILTTMKTLLADNPKLDARVEEGVFKKKIYILGDERELQNKDFQIKHSSQSLKVFSSRDLKFVLKEIGKDEIQDVFVEAGALLLNSLLRESLVNKLLLYVAPKVIGKEGAAAFDSYQNWKGVLKEPQVFGSDVLFEWDFQCLQE